MSLTRYYCVEVAWIVNCVNNAQNVCINIM